jgi:hypothetical protein
MRKIPVISASASWYGVDPIHIKWNMKRRAWPALVAAWRSMDAPLEITPSSLAMAAYLVGLEPFEYSLFGFPRRAVQPNGRLNDGTTISLY